MGIDFSRIYDPFYLTNFSNSYQEIRFSVDYILTMLNLIEEDKSLILEI